MCVILRSKHVAESDMLVYKVVQHHYPSHMAWVPSTDTYTSRWSPAQRDYLEGVPVKGKLLMYRIDKHVNDWPFTYATLSGAKEDSGGAYLPILECLVSAGTRYYVGVDSNGRKVIVPESMRVITHRRV